MGMRILPVTIKIDYDGIKKLRCLRTEYESHLPHFWYDPERFRRYFCRGDA